jgi:putative DNA primase/helicase
MALKSEFGDTAYHIADDWSQTAQNYEPKSFKSVWRSINCSGGLSIATLFYLARENGWQRDQKRNLASSRTELLKLESLPKQNTEIYAKKLWMAASRNDTYVAEHLYAKNKSIGHAGGAARGIAAGGIIGRNTDAIIVPIRNIETDKFQGVQCVNSKGKKQTFGRITGGVLLLGNTLDKTLEWYVAEGWATAFSVVFHIQDGHGVCAVSFGKSNLQKTAELIDNKYHPRVVSILKESD